MDAGVTVSVINADHAWFGVMLPRRMTLEIAQHCVVALRHAQMEQEPLDWPATSIMPDQPRYTARPSGVW